MNEVKAKKFLGQHFLTDETIAQRIVESLSGRTTNLIEIDRESVAWLHDHYPQLKVIEGDFLKLDLNTLFHDSFAVIGNFPYNISSQILFRVFECRNQAVEVVGMFQKEVAERVAAGPGSKTYGILSVLLSAFYNIEFLFTVHEHVFNPPPKVKSAVIRLTRNDVTSLECDESLFVKVVKAGFNQRRKTLRNALRSAALPIEAVDEVLLSKRAEQLSVAEFITLTKAIQQLT